MIKREGMNRKEYGDVSGFPFVKTQKNTGYLPPSCRMYADFCVAFFAVNIRAVNMMEQEKIPGDGNDH